jgi:formiminotetrahydrofolate cyclodeaminase
MCDVSEQEVSYSAYVLIDLLDAFASNDAVPGGGSASALAGALGVSLLIMVAGLPKTRSGESVPEEATDLAEASARLRPLRDALVTSIDADSEAFRSVLAAARLPKASEPEEQVRLEAMQAAMREATEEPLEAMRACQQALAGAVIVARNALRAAASDVGVAVELLAAAVRGCALNIDTNLAGIKDDQYRERLRIERQQLEADSTADADRARQLLRT